ncbi:thioredoxin family protein [Nanoarchaeota archaeon]
MKITVFTTENCPNSLEAKKVCEEVAQENDLKCEELDIIDHKIEAYSRQIVSAPSIEIGEEVVFRGQVPSRDALLAEIEKRKGE